MLQETVNTVLIQLRKWLQDICVFIWKHKIVKKTCHGLVFEPKNAELKNIHLGRRAFIIGNGPSILKQDLTKLKGEITFALNDFFLHPQYREISPMYLCSCDPSIVNPDLRIKWYNLQRSIDTRKTTMFFKKSAQKIDRENDLFREYKVYYLNAASMLLPPMSDLTYFPIDLTMPLSGHNLVMTDVALPVAIYMGIKTIYLLGFDSQPVTSFNDYLNYDFYGKHPLALMSVYKRDYQFHVLSRAFKNYRKGLHEKTIACIRRTCKKLGVRVLNATHNRGYFEGFDHIDYDKIVIAKK